LGHKASNILSNPLDNRVKNMIPERPPILVYKIVSKKDILNAYTAIGKVAANFQVADKITISSSMMNKITEL